MKSQFYTLLLAALLQSTGAWGAERPQPVPLVPQAYLEAARKAKEEFTRGNYREAEKTYRGLLTAIPHNLYPYILSNLGVVRFRSGEFKLAVKTFRQAIAIAPNDAFSHCTLGIVYYSQKRYDDAIKSLRRAIELEPGNATAHDYLGHAYSEKGMLAEADKEWNITRRLDPSYFERPDEIPANFRPNES